MAAVDGSLRFHSRCGRSVHVKKGGKALEKKGGLRSLFGERYGHSAALTDRPLGVSEWFEIEVIKLDTTLSGYISFGVISHSPKGIEYPQYMRENKSGAWLLHCVSTGSIGGHIVVNGEEVKKGYIPKDSISSLKEGDRLGLMVDLDQSLVFSLNGENLGVAATDIPQGAYGFVEISLMYKEARIISHPIQVNGTFDAT